VWQGLQQITQYKQKPTPANNDPTLPDQLNHFYSRYDMKNTTKASSHSSPKQAVPPDSDSGLPPIPFAIQLWEVKRLFTELNIRKAAGPDNISQSTLPQFSVKSTTHLSANAKSLLASRHPPSFLFPPNPKSHP